MLGQFAFFILSCFTTFLPYFISFIQERYGTSEIDYESRSAKPVGHVIAARITAENPEEVWEGRKARNRRNGRKCVAQGRKEGRKK